MFMYTAKLNKRKLVLTFAAVVILIVALFIIFNKDDSVETSLLSKVVKNNEERIRPRGARAGDVLEITLKK